MKSKEVLNEAEKLNEKAINDRTYNNGYFLAIDAYRLLKQSRTELLKEVEGIVDEEIKDLNLFEKRKMAVKGIAYRRGYRNALRIIKSKLKELKVKEVT